MSRGSSGRSPTRKHHRSSGHSESKSRKQQHRDRDRERSGTSSHKKSSSTDDRSYRRDSPPSKRKTSSNEDYRRRHSREKSSKDRQNQPDYKKLYNFNDGNPIYSSDSPKKSNHNSVEHLAKIYKLHDSPQREEKHKSNHASKPLEEYLKSNNDTKSIDSTKKYQNFARPKESPKKLSDQISPRKFSNGSIQNQGVSPRKSHSPSSFKIRTPTKSPSLKSDSFKIENEVDRSKTFSDTLKFDTRKLQSACSDDREFGYEISNVIVPIEKEKPSHATAAKHPAPITPIENLTKLYDIFEAQENKANKTASPTNTKQLQSSPKPNLAVSTPTKASDVNSSRNPVIKEPTDDECYNPFEETADNKINPAEISNDQIQNVDIPLPEEQNSIPNLSNGRPKLDDTTNLDESFAIDDIPLPCEVDQASQECELNFENMFFDMNASSEQYIDAEMELYSDSSASSLEEDYICEFGHASSKKDAKRDPDIVLDTGYQKHLYKTMQSRIIMRHKKTHEALWGRRSIKDYKFIKQLGEGTYGMVYKAFDTEDDNLVAIKKVRCENEKDGFPIFVIREIKILKQLMHQNVISLKDVLVDKKSKTEASFYLVFEYMNHDLMGFLESRKKQPLQENQICYLFYQLSEAVAHCHQQGFMHRDLKCSNLLLNNTGILKLADFGLSRPYQKYQPNDYKTAYAGGAAGNQNVMRPYTNKVITLWYRPPELLLGYEHYTPAVDVWSMGCILGEMFLLRPLFSANSELSMLDVIFKICGTPNTENWPQVSKIPAYNSVSRWKQHKRIVLEEYREKIDGLALDLLDRMLTLDPTQRISSTDVIQHQWILNLDQDEVKPFNLPEDSNFNEMYLKSERKQQKLIKRQNLAVKTA